MVLTKAAGWKGWLALLLLMLLPLLARAVEPVPAPGPVAPPPEFPEFSQVAPYVTDLEKQASSLQGSLQPKVSASEIEKSLNQSADQFRDLVKTMDALGAADSWYTDRVLNFDEQLRVLRRSFTSIQDSLTGELQRLEGIHQDWDSRRNYLEQWRSYLKKADAKLPAELFRHGLTLADQVVSDVSKAQGPLLALQQRVSALLGDVQQKRSELDAVLRSVRTETFRKNSHSFFSPDFYHQFQPDLLAELKAGVNSALDLGEDLWRRFGLVLLSQLVLVLVLPLLICRFARRERPPEEWEFLIKHPLATGIFVAVAAGGGFYQAPPPLLRFALYAFGVGSVAILIAALAPSRRRGLVVLSLATLFLLSTALRMISLPLPLYRVYLLLLYLFGAPTLWLVSVRARKARGRLNSFIVSLRFGALLILIALGAQLAGCVNLSYGLVQASVETLFAYLFLLMAFKLGFGAIDFVLGRGWLRQRQFIRQHGGQLGQRLKKLFRLVAIVYALLFLFKVWGLFDSFSGAWETMLGWSVSLGDAQITLRMVLLSVVTLYLTYQLSWFLQASIDTQLLQRRQVDRGVRDAIKKLLHYALVLIGFLVALSSLGFQLQHLVVLAGAFGVGIGFGLQDIVNNFLSGLILLFERPVKLGDGILVDGEYGTVVKIGLRSTVVETLDQAELIVPNSQIISQKVTNWTLSNRRVRLVVPVGVAYGSNLELVLQILTDAGSEHPDVLAEPVPSPIFVAFGDSSLNFELRVWLPNVDIRPRVKSELLLYIDRRFREAGVEIPFPQRDLHLRSVDDKALRSLRDPSQPGGEEV